ncbi:PREDICTED: melanoma-associated antigen B3 [Myotis brandtii]|uniref:melanoma-associated antigen B3 n=1 Tax=Myotis brandtii TaxID=109478 RepID=UPI000703F756|nr:PREDICTED: melanoma-associated antigen B3 [Myotis brandtii]
MPRCQKNKLHTREKHHQAQGETQGLRGAKEKALPSSPSAPLQAVSQSKPARRSCSIRRCTHKAPSTITKSASHTKLSKGVNCKTENKQSSSKTSPSKAKSQRDPLTEMSNILVQFLMQMYKMKKPIKKADMLKIIHKKYKNSFSEILSRASFNIEVVFGVDLKEVDGMKHLYNLVNKMDLPNNGRVHRGRGFPKTGLLMTILGVIFMKGNCATEQKIWEFLNKMKIYAGKRHFIFGEPKKLITQDFVKLKYLEYRQVPSSDPPCYEFLWGPRAYAETSKMKVLQFFAKINQTIPSAFTSWYEEALQDEKERAQAPIPLRADTNAMAVNDSGSYPAAPPTPGEVEVIEEKEQSCSK